jgi:hypothetical protein
LVVPVLLDGESPALFVTVVVVTSRGGMMFTPIGDATKMSTVIIVAGYRAANVVGISYAPAPDQAASMFACYVVKKGLTVFCFYGEPAIAKASAGFTGDYER